MSLQRKLSNWVSPSVGFSREQGDLLLLRIFGPVPPTPEHENREAEGEIFAAISCSLLATEKLKCFQRNWAKKGSQSSPGDPAGNIRSSAIRKKIENKIPLLLVGASWGQFQELHS